MNLEINIEQQYILVSALRQYIVGAEEVEAKAAAQGFDNIKAANYGVDTAKELLEQVKALR